jgi:hypothetical protein
MLSACFRPNSDIPCHLAIHIFFGELLAQGFVLLAPKLALWYRRGDIPEPWPQRDSCGLRTVKRQVKLNVVKLNFYSMCILHSHLVLGTSVDAHLVVPHYNSCTLAVSTDLQWARERSGGRCDSGLVQQGHHKLWPYLQHYWRNNIGYYLCLCSWRIWKSCHVSSTFHDSDMDPFSWIFRPLNCHLLGPLMQNALSIVLNQLQSSQLQCFCHCYMAILELDVYSCNNYSRTKIIRSTCSFTDFHDSYSVTEPLSKQSLAVPWE